MSTTLAGSVRRIHWHRPEWCALGLAAVGWVGLLVVDEGGAGSSVAVLGHASAMAAAMMSPLVLEQVHRVATFSLWRRRYRAVSGFLAGYLGVWTLTGALLIVAGSLVVGALGRPPAIVVAFLVAVLVTVLPGRRRGLRQCSTTRPLTPSGWRADRDTVLFGLQTGHRSMRSCWALMLATIVSHSLLVMAAATAIAYAEARYPDRQGRCTAFWVAQLGLVALVLASWPAMSGMTGHVM